MKLTVVHRNFLVIDDFLKPEASKDLWNFCQEETFRPVHGEKWIKAFRLTDGQPMWGSVYLSHKNPTDKTSSVFPCGRGVDRFIAAMLEYREQWKPYVGELSKEWSHFFTRPYLYPAGSGLSWHTDGRGDVAGAFVYYAHREWNPQWGAELLIDDSGFLELDYPEVTMMDGSQKKLGLHFDNSPAMAKVAEHGVGHYVVAKPNRLVILRKGVIHRIQRVDACAGDNTRISLTGFFLKPSQTSP